MRRRALLSATKAPLLISLLTGLRLAWGARPYFSTDSPAHDSVFYAFPGQRFALPAVTILDPDENGTDVGTIIASEPPGKPPWSFFSSCTGSDLKEPANNPFSTKTGCKIAATHPWSTADCPDGICASSSMNFAMSPVPGPILYTNRSTVSVDFQLPFKGEFETVPAPYYYLCIEAQDRYGGQGFNPSVTPYEVRCFKVLIQLPPRPVFSCPSFKPASISMSPVSEKCALNALQMHTKIGVGQTLKGWAYFEDLNRDGTAACNMCDQIQMSVLADPGLPNGATLKAVTGGPDSSKMPQQYSNQEKVYFGTSSSETSTQYLFSRELTFTPTIYQAGLTYKMSITATDEHDAAKKSKGLPSNHTSQSYTLEVMEPDIMIRLDAAAGPFNVTDELDRPTAVSPQTAHNAHVQVRVGCDYKWTIGLYEKLDLDPSSSVDATTASNSFQRGIYSYTASASAAHGLPEGAQLSAPRRVSVCAVSGLPAPCPEGQSPEYPLTEIDVSWRPPRGSESNETISCLDFHEQTYPSLRGRTQCVKFEVLKCQVCVKYGDTLVSMAREYKTDWLQLWGANVGLSNPHLLVDPGQQMSLTLGPTHEVDAAVKLELLAKRFRMTPEHLLTLNPDLAHKLSGAQDVVPAGEKVCLIPDICSQPDDLTL